jgi:hypothetical protein
MRCFALSAVGFVVIALAQWGSIRADEGAYPGQTQADQLTISEEAQSKLRGSKG